MSKDEIKIQPDDAEEKVGQPSQEATDELPEYTAEELAGKSPQELADLLGNVKKMRAEATQKFMKASDLEKQAEFANAKAKYLEEQNKKMQETIQEIIERRNATQPAGSTTTQPPKYDPYNPEQWARDYESYMNSLRAEDKKQYEKLAGEIESLRNETNVAWRTQKFDAYLDKILPIKGKDVRKQDIITYFGEHPNLVAFIEDGSVDKAVEEEQARIERIKAEALKEDRAKKKEFAQGAQLKPGSPLATQKPDIEKLRSRSPAERDDAIASILHKLRDEGAL